MRKLIKCTGCLVLLFTFLLSFQIKAQENQISVYSYVYVEPDQMGEFMNRMETYWYNVAEKTASSIYDLHFGRYKAVAKSDYLSECHALLLSLAATTGYSVDCW